MKRIFSLCFLMIWGISAVLAISPLSFSGSIPENEGYVSSFDDIQIQFDLSEIETEYGSLDGWGISREGKDNAKPARINGAILYKGDVSDGEILSQITNSIKAGEEGYVEGNTIHLSFPGVEVIPGQKYSVYVNYIVYASRVDDPASYGYMNLRNAPITIILYGAENVVKQLSVVDNSLALDKSLEYLDKVSIKFNYDIELTDAYQAILYEGDAIVGNASNFVANGDLLDIEFETIPLYYTHSYKLVLSKNSVYMKSDPSLLNSELSFNIDGASYKKLEVGRGVNPPNNECAVLDEIIVPFNFPKSETTTYGLTDTETPLMVYVYADNDTEADPLFTMEGEASADCTSLIIRPSYAFEPSSTYTFVIPEGEVRVYDIYARVTTYLKEYISERVVLNYTTPAIEDLPKWTPSPVNVKNDEEVAELKYIILDNPEYEFDGTIYKTVFNKNLPVDRKKAALYLVTEEGDQEILTFRFTRPTLDSSSEIGNGELEGQYFVGEVNETLYEGNQYKIVWFANDVVVDSPFIGRFIGNPEICLTFKGATPISDDFGLTANVDDRLHSHADVFSFVTESEIKAGENAKMILKDGEENIAEAPVYVSREANGHRVYADFGGKKLDAGKSYDVVLPEGSVYATNGIVNNPEIKSALTAMPETPAAPEFISVALNIDDYASATYRMVKGQESVVDLKAGEDWKLESLSLNGEDVTADVAENGLYTLPALDEDANLDATYAYAHAIDYDYETGVGNIEDLPYSLSKDGSHVVISGLNGGEQIAIYTMGGMKIASLDTVPTDMHEASIALPEGQIYIVMINNTSIKWKH